MPTAVADEQTIQEENPAIIGGFEVLNELGRGPLGKIYRAKNVETGEIVALRGFARPKEADARRWKQAVDRYRDLLKRHQLVEAHSSIQKIVAFGEQGRIFWVASEYFEGRPLRAIIDEDGPQPLEWAVGLFREVAAALDYSAASGLPHTDLTPYNVLVTRSGGVRVINFGLGHTRDKTGSPYAAPEQLSGFEGDLRSDIYSLGALLYETVSGRPAFSGATAEEVRTKVQTTLPAPLVGQPGYCRDVLTKMLAKAPHKRYRVALDAIEDLAHRRSPDMSQLYESTEDSDPAEFGRFKGKMLPTLADYSLTHQDLLDIHFKRKKVEEKRAESHGKLRRRWALGIAAVVLLAFSAHAAFRPGANHVATIAAITGKPKVTIDGDTRELKAGENLQSLKPFTISTDSKSTVLVAMQGARLSVAPDTLLVVKRLAFERGRVRLFEVKKGRIWARVNKLRGANAKFEVACQGFRARVKGTDFGVRSIEGGALISTLEGAVRVDSGEQHKLVEAGNMLRAYIDHDLKDPASLSDEEKAALEKHLEELKASLMAQLGDILSGLEEATLVPLVQKTLDIAHLNPGAAAQVMEDAKIVSRAQIAMDAICKSLAATGSDGLPESLTLDTLSELGMEKKDRDRLLEPFENHRLLKYERLGNDSYQFEGRATDSSHTLLRAKDGKVTIVKEEDEEKHPSKGGK